MKINNNIVKVKSFSFAVKINSVSRELQEIKQFVLADQILRSGTSVGANIEEALAAVSKRDFHAKMSIASKEARENHYWLRLLKEADFNITNRDILLEQAAELIRILTLIVKSTRTSLKEKH